MSTEALRRIGGGRLIDAASSLFGGAGSVISLAKYLPVALDVLGLAKAWSAIDLTWTTAAGVKARAEVICQLGELLAKQTPSTDDDAVAAKFRLFATSDTACEIAAGVLSRFAAAVPDPTPAALIEYLQNEQVVQALQESATEQQIDFNVILELIQMIAKFIAMFQSKAPIGTATPTNGGSLDF